FARTEDTKETKDTKNDGASHAHHFTSLRAIAPGGSGNELGSRAPFTGGRSWNMKSHFQRSDGFDACSQCRASSGRLKVRSGSAASPSTAGLRAAMSARTCAAAV